jgi:hypothetical protein
MIYFLFWATQKEKNNMNLSIAKECIFLELQNSEDIIIFVQLRIKKNTIMILYVCRLYD